MNKRIKTMMAADKIDFTKRFPLQIKKSERALGNSRKPSLELANSSLSDRVQTLKASDFY